MTRIVLVSKAISASLPDIVKVKRGREIIYVQFQSKMLSALYYDHN